MRRIAFIFALAAFAFAPAFDPPKEDDFKLTSPVVTNGGNLPAEFTCDGASASPPIAWSNPPKGTRAFAVTMHHIARDNERHVYWVIGNIPASTKSIAKNFQKAGVMGVNTINRKPEYAPPCSKGPGPKEYTITLYALSRDAVLPDHPLTMDELLAAVKDCTLATRTLKVIYERPRTAPQ